MVPNIEEYPVFDEPAVMERLEGDKEFLFELFDMLQAEFVTVKEDLQDGFTSKDSAKLKDRAHYIKSAFGNIGAMRAYHIAFLIEQLGKQGVVPDSDELLTTLNEEFEKFKAFLSTYK